MSDELKISLEPTPIPSNEDCEGCKTIVATGINDKIPSRCPVCGRSVSELIRETYYRQQKRELRR